MSSITRSNPYAQFAEHMNDLCRAAYSTKALSRQLVPADQCICAK
ncbi:hypothetical protein [Rhizobium sp. Leaf386]|nr:hypothetical protein [Rhizobium sp. Leaf386]